MLKFLDHLVFQIVSHFHQSHLNQIRTWHELNRLHFHLHHLNQSWFQGMLKFLDHDFVHVVTHFDQLDLNQIHTWHELNQKHFHLHHLNQFWFQAMLKFLDWNVYHIVQGVKKVPGPPAISTATLLPDNSVTADSAAHSANKNSD
jgi:hypothetical protein